MNSSGFASPRFLLGVCYEEVVPFIYLVIKVYAENGNMIYGENCKLCIHVRNQDRIFEFVFWAPEAKWNAFLGL